MVGEWVEFKDGIFEVIGETPTDLICKEVLYKSEYPMLKYSDDVTVIRKGLICNG